MNTYKIYVDDMYLGELEARDPFDALVFVMGHAVRRGLMITNSMVFDARRDGTVEAVFYAGGSREDEHDRMLREVRTALEQRDKFKKEFLSHYPVSEAAAVYVNVVDDRGWDSNDAKQTLKALGKTLQMDIDCCDDGEASGFCSGCQKCEDK